MGKQGCAEGVSPSLTVQLVSRQTAGGGSSGEYGGKGIASTPQPSGIVSQLRRRLSDVEAV